jgi:hypothetical protein
VFAQFGEAAYEAQCLEKQMVMVLSYMCSPSPEYKSTLRINELVETNLDQTFGSLAKEIIKNIPLPIDVVNDLERAVRGRNWLSHNYWWDRASEFTRFQDRQMMIVELKELTDLFVTIDRYLTVALKIGLLVKD